MYMGRRGGMGLGVKGVERGGKCNEGEMRVH